MARPGPAAGFEQITHPQKRAILRLYSQTMRLRQSFEAAQTSLWMHYHWLKTDPAYKDAFALARSMAAEALEDEAVRRGIGYDEPLYNEAGEQIGVTHRHSDTLLIFLLKGLRPTVYNTRQLPDEAGALVLEVVHYHQILPPPREESPHGHAPAHSLSVSPAQLPIPTVYRQRTGD